MADRCKELFGEALDLPAAERPVFLRRACGDDDALRARLERLLGAHDEAGDFLTSTAALVEAVARASTDPDDGLRAGDHIGRHELLERLGRGGFGSVWRARQLEPVVREVALKVLHDGTGGARVAERFAAERQALARMEHPGIAKVFDAGTTVDGLAWLTMELVDGEPIGRHCEHHGVALRGRLQLFRDVCLAVQHAHGKGVVHGDLKPANVVVTTRDGVARPVVIDFGVARAFDDPAGGAGEKLGTPEYMSPEQAGGDPHAIDTRSDVWALGVVLYELVTGGKPHRGTDAGHADLLRRIREVDAVPPTRAAVERLPRELDWITARAMARDPAARYQTAAALAEEIDALLTGHPVAAAPPSSWYVARKFVARNSLAVAAATGMVLSLGIGGWLAVSSSRDAERVARESEQAARTAEAAIRVEQQETEHEAERATRAEQAALEKQREAEREAERANRTLALLDEVWSSVDPRRLGGEDYPVRELLAAFENTLPERVAGEPAVELKLRTTLANLHTYVGAYAAAQGHATRVVELAERLQRPVEHVGALLIRARARFSSGDTDGALADAQAAQRLAADDERLTERAAFALEIEANCRARAGEGPRALAIAKRALAVREELDDGLPAARSHMQLANLHGSIGEVDVAMEHVREALVELEPYGPDHADAIVAVQHLAFLQQRRGDFVAAEAGFRDNLERRRRVYGDDHSLVAWAEVDLAWNLYEQKRFPEASPLLEGALPKLRARLGDQHLQVSETIQRIGALAIELGDLDAAARHLEDAVRRFETLPGHPVEGALGALGNLARLQWKRGDREAALATQQRALARAEAELPASHFLISVKRTNLAWMAAEAGDPERAIGLLRAALASSSAAGRAGEVRIQRERLAQLLRAAGRTAEADAVEAGKR